MLRVLVLGACAAACAAHGRPLQLARARPVALRPPHATSMSAQHAAARSRLALEPRGRALMAIRDEARPTAPPIAEVENLESYSDALVQTALIVAAATLFGGGIWVLKGQELALQYFAGYVIEESLSIDNLFVFKLIFDYFAVTGAAQRKVLSYGIWAAAVFRLIMISLGVEAVQHFKPVLLVFAGILLLSSGTILAESFSSSEKEEADLSDNAVVKLCKSLFRMTDEMDGDNFFTLAADGAKVATPLFVALVCIEVSDVVFAVDSVPAVLGVTSDSLIAFTSNMFAIFGLRALYRVLATLVSDFEYLQPAVALVLGFVGSKMVAEYVGYEISIQNSLAAIVFILASGVGLSIALPPETIPSSDGEE
mmetsp:Transcript_19812/g.50405  ORF Transcript_19812/g.50405 Transcript_19812/m.50405 type:complete len:367 (-) Transcript_19812:329-1429(-)